MSARARACGRSRRAARPPRRARRRRARRDRAVPRDRGDIVSSRRSTPPSRSASATCSPANGSSRSMQAVAAMDERHLRAERRPRLRHLDADDPAAEHEEPRRHLLRRRRLDVRPRLRLGETRDRGSSPELPVATTTARRARARRRRPHTPLAVEPPVAAHERDAALGRATGAASESSRSWITSSRRASTAGDVERRRRDAGHPPRLGGQLDGPQQRLRRHARIEGALAADEPLLDDRHLQTRLAEAPGDHLAGRACADHDHVELALLHASPPRRRGRRESDDSVVRVRETTDGRVSSWLRRPARDDWPS